MVICMRLSLILLRERKQGRRPTARVGVDAHTEMWEHWLHRRMYSPPWIAYRVIQQQYSQPRPNQQRRSHHETSKAQSIAACSRIHPDGTTTPRLLPQWVTTVNYTGLAYRPPQTSREPGHVTEPTKTMTMKGQKIGETSNGIGDYTQGRGISGIRNPQKEGGVVLCGCPQFGCFQSPVLRSFMS